CTTGVTFYCAGFTVNGGSGSNLGTDTQQPTITSPSDSVTTQTTSISGGFKATGTTAAIVRIYIDSSLVGSVTPTGSPLTWSYSIPSTIVLKAGDKIRVRAIAATTGAGTITYYCATDTSVTVKTLNCSTVKPTFNTDTITATSGKLIPSTWISGSGNPGDTIKLYKSVLTGGVSYPAINSLLKTIVVGKGGAWTAGYQATTADGRYYASARSTSCSNLAISDTVLVASASQTSSSSYCGGTITSVYTYPTGYGGTNISKTLYPVNTTDTLYSDATNLSGTLNGSPGTNTRVNLYVDSSLVGTYTMGATNAWGPIDVTGFLYNGATVTLGLVETGTKGEVICSSVKVTCACALNHAAAKPILASNNLTIQAGQTATFDITNPVGGYFYSVRDSATGVSLSKGTTYTASNSTTSVSGRLTGITANGDLFITTIPVSKVTVAEITATAVSGTESCTSTSKASIVLPIVLLEFKGISNQKQNVISWKTASEINASHFVLEKSTDGINFSLLEVMGASGIASSYNYNDLNIDTVDYYRLRMVDLDGNAKFSNVIMLKNGGTSITLNTVRPNPFSNLLRFSLYLNKAQEIKYMLIDAGGRIVRAGQEPGIKGTNDFKINSLNDLPNGVYTMRIDANGTIYQEKVVKLER
ncbi:MAG: hypothetical protein JWP88_1233, partial [Flaviaesturariibacter sp.]|nr:hypothetical protein [Flaviaesturariibacter sp.]